MYLVDIRSLEEEFYKNSVPLFSKENITYMRNEKEGFKSCYSKEAPFFNELIINPTAYEILNLCNGERNPESICCEAMNIFTDVEKETLEQDLKQLLFQYSKTSLISWKEGKNPFMNNHKKCINDNFKLEVANETQLMKLKSFFELNAGEDNLKYVNPSKNSMEYRDALIYREKLFMYSEEFIVLTDENDEIKGVLSLLIPSIRNSSVKSESASTVGVVDMPEPFIKEALKFAVDIIQDIAVNDISKIKYKAFVDNKNHEELKSIFIENGFKSEAILEKEYGDKDIELVSYIY